VVVHTGRETAYIYICVSGLKIKNKNRKGQDDVNCEVGTSVYIKELVED
jgi:hypothetical protein